jgi:hypothetical protein
MVAQEADHLAWATALFEEAHALSLELAEAKVVTMRSGADHWREWRGWALWAALTLRARWHSAGQIAAIRGRGPYYCPTCETRPADPGWKRRKCLDCEWSATLEADARELARDVCRQLNGKPISPRPRWAA